MEYCKTFQTELTNSLAIGQEISRFESVHPNIYQIYELIDEIPLLGLQRQIRDRVVNIEDAFVNSQEWTLSRSVPEIKLGVLGNVTSGKSALVHRYLTGSYLQDDSPEGGRFKKEIVVDSQNLLLLIRDEGGPPELQFCLWVDAVIFVFNLGDERSFNTIINYYNKMSHYRNTSEIPLLLVGTQDGIGDDRPRVIDDSRARKLANELRKCSYFETCAGYGLNVERVFQDAAQKVVQSRRQNLSTPVPSLTSSAGNNSVPTTPNHSSQRHFFHHSQHSITSSSRQSESSSTHGSSTSLHHIPHQIGVNAYSISEPLPNPAPPPVPPALPPRDLPHRQQGRGVSTNPEVFMRMEETFEEPGTPGAKRKGGMRRRSNLFTQCIPLQSSALLPDFSLLPNKKEEKLKTRSDNAPCGGGRTIPVKEGFLFKMTSKPWKSEWKEKYVILCDDGKLTYYSSINDYMDNNNGKEIHLLHSCVKVPSKQLNFSTSNGGNFPSNDSLPNELSQMSLDADETLEYSRRDQYNSSDSSRSNVFSDSGPGALKDFDLIASTNMSHKEHAKKKHKRQKSISQGKTGTDYKDSEEYAFVIVSLDNKQLLFEASSVQARDQWVYCIEQQILSCLQRNNSNSYLPNVSEATQQVKDAIRAVQGNSVCADCSEKDPQWATTNIGGLVCINCSGIHRQLGTHISRIRSVGLDDWPPDQAEIMKRLGNKSVNEIWEGSLPKGLKPSPSSSREEREKFIFSKYRDKKYLAKLQTNIPLEQLLLNAIQNGDVYDTSLLLAHCNLQHINHSFAEHNSKTCLHFSCDIANVVITQLLLWFGANPTVFDADGRSPLSYARAVQSNACARLLLNSGMMDEAITTLPRQSQVRSLQTAAPAFNR